MPAFCFSFTKVASCFCLPPPKGKVKNKVDPEQKQKPSESQEKGQVAKTGDDKALVRTRSPESVLPTGSGSRIVEIASQPSPQNTSGNEGTGEHHLSYADLAAQLDTLRVDWTSGARKETITINWIVQDFHALCDLKELLRNETLVFSAGHTINTLTRWCFNLQRMKNESNIGLFLKRLKPLSLTEDSDEFQNRNRNTDNSINLEVIPPSILIDPLLLDESDESECDAVYIHYECRVKRSGTNEIWLHKRTCIPNFEIGQRLGFRKLFTLDDLKEADLKAPTLPPLLSAGNTLHLEIKFNLHLRSNGKTKSEMNLLKSMSQENHERFHFNLLSSELSGVLESGKNADLILIMEADDKTFSVHKSVLAARSAVFAAMFHSGMKESRTGVVRIKDVTSKAMESLLRYVYSGTADVGMKWSDVREVQDLIYAADKYAVKGLRDLCDHMMFSGCMKENAMELLYLAQSHNLNEAVRKISLFIKRHVDDVLCPEVN